MDFSIVKKIDPYFIALALVLSFFGFLIIFSVDSQKLPAQLIFFAISFLAFFFVSMIDYKIYQSFSFVFFLTSVFLLLALFLFGKEIRGAVRWFDLGFFLFQPSEFVKLLIIIILASFFSLKEKVSLLDLTYSLFLVLIPAFLIFKQPDLGNALLLLVIWLIMGFLSGTKLKNLFILIAIFLLLSPLFWKMLEGYQKDRVIAFLNPTFDPLGKGYSIIQSKIAVGSGQFFGKSLGYGSQSKLLFLPERSTDFAFAALAEELGFLGSLILISVFLFLTIKCFQLCFTSSDRYTMLLTAGLTALLVIQAFLAISSNIGLLPVTGVTLPFISYGGSSLLTSFLALGILSSLAKFRRV